MYTHSKPARGRGQQAAVFSFSTGYVECPNKINNTDKLAAEYSTKGTAEVEAMCDGQDVSTGLKLPSDSGMCGRQGTDYMQT